MDKGKDSETMARSLFFRNLTNARDDGTIQTKNIAHMFEYWVKGEGKMAEKIGLVLEGGGMRGIYTVGVLDRLLELSIMPDYVIGVSAGACNGLSYVSRQTGRGYRIIMDYIGDARYVSVSNYLKTGSMFGMDFIFDEIPHKLDLYDYDALLASPCEYVVGVTDVRTGQPVYFDKRDMDHDSTVFRASSALPFFSHVVEYKGGQYLDGGTADPIPVRKALADGCDRLVVVLTQHRDYRKKPQKHQRIYARALRQYPAIIEAMNVRHQVYNDTLDYIQQLEREGTALVIAPHTPVTIGRFEKNTENLNRLYEQGKQDTIRAEEALKALFSL